MLLGNLPNELIILVGDHLPAHDLYSLILVNHRFSSLFSTRLYSLAIDQSHSFTALFWAVASENRPLAQHVLSGAPNIIIPKFGQPSFLVELGFKSPGPCDPTTLDWIMSQHRHLLVGDPSIIPPPYLLGSIDTKCDTALSWAVKQPHHSLLRLILKNPAYESRNARGIAITQAIKLGHEKVISIFLEEGIHPDRDGIPRPLSTAVEFGRVGIVRLLLDHGARVLYESRYGRPETYFGVAEAKGDKEMARLLLERSIIAYGHFSDAGRPAIYLAALYGIEVLVDCLINQGFASQIEFKDVKGRTALHVAAEKGYDVVVGMLLDGGAEVGVDAVGKSPYDLAAAEGHEDVMKVFVERGVGVDMALP